RAYNILFESIDLSDAKAQKEAFADTWSNVSYIDELNEIQDLNLDLFRFLKTLDSLRISKGAVSYLTIMAHRIWYMRKKLKSTGSFYLHCDPTMSHYLKIVLDLIFGVKNFRNEIVWWYETGGIPKNDFSRKHDVIFRYSKSRKYHFNSKEIKEKRSDEVLRRIATGVVSATRSTGQYRHPSDVWKIAAINAMAEERMGYPTQKPEVLLERIIKASSNEGDMVADFFCGCGTTVISAQKLNRKWIGVDISHLAIRLIYERILKPFEESDEKYIEIVSNIDINGFPKDIASAKDLAQKTKKGRLKFQDWVIEIMLRGVSNPKKTADGGYDGYVTFYKSPEKKDIVLIEVKSGNVNVNKIRELIEVVNREKASIGVLVCFEEQVTKPMIVEAKGAGYYEPQVFMNRYDKIQIITIEELLEGKSINYPLYQNITFKNASKVDIKENNNSNSLFD
ncbi:restriction endonuclease, partial [bacterium]|nr:restriction endonuclease [bacterium]